MSGELRQPVEGVKCFGRCVTFGLVYDRLTANGIDRLVTPPSLIPTQSGSKVKTDKKDSLKFARLLENNMLKRVWVLSPEDRAHRQILRTRWQIINHRSDVMRQIKSLLIITGMDRDPQRIFNAQVLFDPFKEQFNVPSATAVAERERLLVKKVRCFWVAGSR